MASFCTFLCYNLSFCSLNLRKNKEFLEEETRLLLQIQDVSSPRWNATLGIRAVCDTYHFVKTLRLYKTRGREENPTR